MANQALSGPATAYYGLRDAHGREDRADEQRPESVVHRDRCGHGDKKSRMGDDKNSRNERVEKAGDGSSRLDPTHKALGLDKCLSCALAPA